MCWKKEVEFQTLMAEQTSHVGFIRTYLTKSTRQYAEQDFLTCPLGVLLLLTTIFGSGGSRGNTSVQIARTLQLKSPTEPNRLSAAMNEAKSLYQDLVNELTSADTVIDNKRVNVMSIATGVFVKDGLPLEPKFRWSVTNEFRATVQQLDFNNQSASADIINGWVNQETKGLIPRLFRSAYEVPRESRVVLLNAFTFKDDWASKFKPYDTHTEDFYVDAKNTIKVSMMSSVETMAYANMPDKGFAMIKKPMQNNRFSFIVLLPTEQWNLQGAEMVLNGMYSLRELVKSMDNAVVSLKLPKFKMTKELNLIPILESMGTIDLFRSQLADMSGMSNAERLYISLLKQTIVLKVDEVGVEAAAVTHSSMLTAARVDPQIGFYVDQPFVCFIYDEQFQIPIVASRVRQPAF
ncbi:unnamed protein product [Calicophoron daubneyi]|uniref:Serpin domain-containing protein n=1 Tax=Calicophoron daubneyi TaxID=300641 RepID=A0AAV2TVR9_CALDB